MKAVYVEQTGPPEVFSGSHGFFAGVTGSPVELDPLADAADYGRELIPMVREGVALRQRVKVGEP